MKTKKLEIKVTPYEMLQVEQQAERLGTTKSDLMRRIIATFPEPNEGKVNPQNCQEPAL